MMRLGICADVPETLLVTYTSLLFAKIYTSFRDVILF